MLFFKRVGIRSILIFSVLIFVIVFSGISFVYEYIDLYSFLGLILAALVFGGLNYIERRQNIQKEKDLNFQKAEKCIQRNDWRAAISIFDKILDLYPKNVNAVMRKAFCQRQRTDFASAIATYKRALEIDKKQVEAYFLLGICYFKEKRYDDALNSFKKNLELNPGNSEAFLFIGDLYRIWDEYSKAETYYRKYLEQCNDEKIKTVVLEKLESIEKANSNEKDIKTIPLNGKMNSGVPRILRDLQKEKEAALRMEQELKADEGQRAPPGKTGTGPGRIDDEDLEIAGSGPLEAIPLSQYDFEDDSEFEEEVIPGKDMDLTKKDSNITKSSRLSKSKDLRYAG